MMKMKLNTKVELDLASKWLTKFGIPHEIKGFTVTHGDIENSLKECVLSAIRLNDGVCFKHIMWN